MSSRHVYLALASDCQSLQILALDAPMDIEDQGMQTFLAFLRSEIFPVFGRSTNRLEDLQVSLSLIKPLTVVPVYWDLSQRSDS